MANNWKSFWSKTDRAAAKNLRRSGESTFRYQQNVEHITRGAYFSSINSVSAAQASLAAILEMTEGNLDKITYDAARELYRRSVALVPLRTGRLMQSIRVDRIYGKGGRVSGFRAYAFAVNPETGEEYAVEQHENTSYRHLPGRTDHYISKPFEEVVGIIDRQLKANAKWIMEKAFDYTDPANERDYAHRRAYGYDSFEEQVKRLSRIPRYKGLDFKNVTVSVDPGMSWRGQVANSRNPSEMIARGKSATVKHRQKTSYKRSKISGNRSGYKKG